MLRMLKVAITCSTDDRQEVSSVGCQPRDMEEPGVRLVLGVGWGGVLRGGNLGCSQRMKPWRRGARRKQRRHLSEGRAWILPTQPMLLVRHFLTCLSIQSQGSQGHILLQRPCQEVSPGLGPTSGGPSAWKATPVILHLAIQSYCFSKAQFMHYTLPTSRIKYPLSFFPHSSFRIMCLSLSPAYKLLEFLVPSIRPSIQ